MSLPYYESLGRHHGDSHPFHKIYLLIWVSLGNLWVRPLRDFLSRMILKNSVPLGAATGKIWGTSGKALCLGNLLEGVGFHRLILLPVEPCPLLLPTTLAGQGVAVLSCDP